MQNNIEFSERLIKGKIAEVIFEQMFRETKNFTILHSGCEQTMPELAQYRRTLNKEVVKDISGMPDFVLIHNNKKSLYIVEVKYCSSVNTKELQKIAGGILKKWDPSWLFVASPIGFFFSPCHTIINKGGFIEPLSSFGISKKIQNEYLNLLRGFEK